MAKFNIKKMLIGLVFMILALLCAVTAFYILEVKPEIDARKKTGIEKSIGLKTLINKKVKEVSKKVVKKKPESRIKSHMSKISEKIKKTLAKKEPKEALKKKELVKGSAEAEKSIDKSISVKALVREAEAVYDDKEKSRREGLLWVDRKTGRFMVTLGAMHGLKIGSNLSVYVGSSSIGQVKVDSLFDVISFVSPIKKSLDLSKQNYYKIVIE